MLNILCSLINSGFKKLPEALIPHCNPKVKDLISTLNDKVNKGELKLDQVSIKLIPLDPVLGPDLPLITHREGYNFTNHLTN